MYVVVIAKKSHLYCYCYHDGLLCWDSLVPYIVTFICERLNIHLTSSDTYRENVTRLVLSFVTRIHSNVCRIHNCKLHNYMATNLNEGLVITVCAFKWI